MKAHLFKIFVIFVFIWSCSNNRNQAYFQVQNSTKDVIKNISISNGVNKEKLPKLISNDKVNINLSFEDVPRADGGYQIIYFLDSKKYVKNFGYYSNGVPTNSIYSLEIKKDTVLIKEYRK